LVELFLLVKLFFPKEKVEGKGLERETVGQSEPTVPIPPFKERWKKFDQRT